MIGRIAGSIGRGLYKGATTKAGAATIIGGAALAGFGSKVLPATRDAAMDVAFGDPNADQSFIGRKITPGALFDTVVPGGQSGAGALGISAVSTMGGAAIGGLAAKSIKGGLIGAGIGAAVGMGTVMGLTGAYVGRNEKFFRQSPYSGERRLNRDMTYGGLLYNKKGKRNTSLETAQQMNADGNIVLGMFNLRRGGM
jgi:hypothetical protein